MTIKYALSQIPKRALATKAAVQSSESSPSAPEVIATLLPSKLMVSSLDVGGPLSRVSVIVKCGPRNETSHNLGTSHIIRSMTGCSTSTFTGFAVVRNIQHSGAHLMCVGDREITAFNVVAARHNIQNALKFLGAVVCKPAFKPWEITDNFPRVRYEVGILTPQAKTMDMLHRAAFRTGLGNSLFVRKDTIGKHDRNMLLEFFHSGFLASKTAIVGYNINHCDLLEFAKSVEMPEGPDRSDEKINYYGGEIRKEKNSELTYIAIGAQGTGMRDLKESLIYSVLRNAYGSHPSVKWGSSPNRVNKAVTSIPNSMASCFNISYSDTGLFGVFISSDRKNAGKAVDAVYKALRAGGPLSDADVNRAKVMLKCQILSSCEFSENLVEDMGVQSLFGEVIIPGPVIAEAIDKITPADVNAAAKKVSAGRLSYVAFGDLSEVPYLDQLK